MIGMFVISCGGIGGKGKDTTPEAKNDNKSDGKNSTGSVVYEEKPGGFAPAPVPANAPAPQDIEPGQSGSEPAAGTGKLKVKPPTQDLPPDKRDALVLAELRKGGAAIAAKDADGAIRFARGALDIDESNVEAMILLAHAYYLKEYDDKVEQVLGIAQKQSAGANHPVLYMLLGLMYDRTNRESQALDAYEKATSLKADYLAAMTNKGAIYLKRKRYTDAITVFERVVQIQGKSARNHTHLGNAYRGHSAEVAREERDSFLKKAETEFKTSMTMDPSYSLAYFNLGILYLDAEPFPGMDLMVRLQNAQRYLTEYKRNAGPQSVAVADEYLTTATKAIDKEEKKRKKEQQKKDKEAKDQQKEKKNP
jgi:tetratricopeptide (TPR) repeat protein